AVPDPLLDQCDDLGDRLRRLRLGVGTVEAERLGVLDVPPGRVRGQFGAAIRRGFVDAVVDVRDVLDERDVVTTRLEPALEPRRDDVRARVADVDALVDGRAAGVHAEPRGWIRQVDLRLRQRVK